MGTNTSRSERKAILLKRKTTKRSWDQGIGLVHPGLQCPGGDLVFFTAKGENHTHPIMYTACLSSDLSILAPALQTVMKAAWARAG